MEIDKNIRSNDPIIDEYIEQLESALLMVKTGNINKLIAQADELAGAFADDFSLIIKGERDGLKLLSSDSSDKLTERMMLVLKSIETFKAVSDTAQALVPKVKATVEEEAATKKETDINVPLIERMPRKSKLK